MWFGLPKKKKKREKVFLTAKEQPTVQTTAELEGDKGEGEKRQGRQKWRMDYMTQ